MQPDHILAASVGLALGFIFGLAFAAIALGSAGSVRRRLAAGALALSLSTICGAVGCVVGFQALWDITRDAALAGVGATVGALALSLTAGGLTIAKMTRIL